MKQIDSIYVNYKAHALQGLLANPNLKKMDVKTSLRILAVASDMADLFTESDEPYLDIKEDGDNPFPFRR